MEQKQYDVFISYSRKDYKDEDNNVMPDNVISKIKDVFDANGISYWFDEDGVYSGDAFAPLIAKNIKSSKIFLFVSSMNSNASEWTSNEIATAHAYKKKIIPFRYDNSVYNDSVIIYIARLDYIDYNTNNTKSLERLVSSVKNYLDELAAKEEAERLEAERRIYVEQTKKEKQMKLQVLNDRIETLEHRKMEIDKDILSHEEILIELRNEKRILDNNISELEDEKASLLGLSVENKVKDKTDEETGLKSFEHGDVHENVNNSQKTSFLSKAKEYLKQLSARYYVHLFLVIFLALVFALIGCVFVSGNLTNIELYIGVTGLIVSGVSVCGLIQLLRKNKNGISILFYNGIVGFLMMLYCIHEIFVYKNYGSRMYDIILDIIVLCAYQSVVFILYMIHKKDKKTLYSWDRMKEYRIKNLI